MNYDIYLQVERRLSELLTYACYSALFLYKNNAELKEGKGKIHLDTRAVKEILKFFH
jgi:hypothetical protein